MLSEGSYAKIELNGAIRSMQQVDFDAPVRIASLNPSRPATIAELVVRGASNVVFDNLKFDHTGRKSDSFNVTESSKITIRNSTFDGHLDGSGFGTDRGLKVTRSQDITLENNKVFNFSNGLGFSNVDNLAVLDNDISGIRNDATTFAGVTGARIEDNHFFGAKSPSSLKHKDAIQFWTSPSEAHSKDIIIRGNTFSNKEQAHTIFMGTAMASKNPQTAYENILIEDNHLTVGHVHGIVVEHANGLVIRDNVLERFPGLEAKQLHTPVISVGVKSINVTITGNDVASVPDEANATWNVSGNSTWMDHHKHWTGGIAGVLRGVASDLYKAWTDPGRTDPDVIELWDMAAWPAGRRASSGDATQPALDAVSPDPAEHFSFHAWSLTSGGSRGAFAPDFEAGDTFVLRGYERGTFEAKAGGNPVGPTNEGRYVKLDSPADIAEIAAMSQDVTATTEGGDVILSVDQARGTDVFVFEGLAQEFLAASQPELF